MTQPAPSIYTDPRNVRDEDESDWGVKPRIGTRPFHHFCEVMQRPDVEKRLHSSALTVAEPNIKLNGKSNQARLCEVISTGPGRWVTGGRQPAEVAPGQLVYVKERTIPFRLHLRKQDHYYVAMDAVMAELDQENLRLRPVGQFVVTREVDERARVAVMGSLPFHIGKTFGVEKKGSESDDVGCNKHRIEEVVAVGPGKFGGFVQRFVEFRDDAGRTEMRLVTEPYWETPDCKPGDLIVFTDLARPSEITLAGRKFTLFEFDHSVCAVLDQAI